MKLKSKNKFWHLYTPQPVLPLFLVFAQQIDHLYKHLVILLEDVVEIPVTDLHIPNVHGLSLKQDLRRLATFLHNSDLRDSQKQVWGKWIFSRQYRMRSDLVRNRLAEACSIGRYNSAHPTHLDTICVYSGVAQI